MMVPRSSEILAMILAMNTLVSKDIFKIKGLWIDGAASRIRTADLLITNQLLYRLS